MTVVRLDDALPVIGAGGPPDPVTAPISAYRYLDAKRDLIDAEARTRPLIRLFDNRHQYLGTVAAEQSVNVEEMLHDTGQGDIVVRADDWLIEFLRSDVRRDEDLHITIDPYPNRRSWRWRWGGKVVNVRVKRGEDGLRSVVLECAHNREHLKHILFGATPFSDPALQPIKAWILPGNTRTIIATSLFINLARNYWPLLALPAQALNPGAWIGEASNVLNLNPLNWPVQVQFVNPLFDQSRFSVIMSRWSDAHSVTESMLRDAGCNIRAYTWLPEDEDSPHPELAAIVGQNAARPTRACVVLAVEDTSGVTGPTGTLIDGALNLFAATADNLVTETLFPLDQDGDGVTDPFIRRLLGVAPAVPDIAFRDTEQSSIVSSEHSMFRSKAQKILTGGKSPGWVNQAQTFAIKYALSQLSYAIQTLAGPELTAVETPGSPGLEEIYQGQLDDCVSGDTLIEGPQVKATIAELAKTGLPFKVWSLTPDGQRVEATAIKAFKKGSAELFRYTLSDGRSINATADHRFLTDSGFSRGGDLEIGTPVATVDHNNCNNSPTAVRYKTVHDGDYDNMRETESVVFRSVVGIESLGVDDYYDLHVPGWENYSANGIWNHNTLLAYIQITDPVRALRSGPYGYLEHFEQGSGSAWTIASALTLREGHYKTRPYQGFKVEIRNGGQYSLYYDFDLGTRCHFEIDGVLHTDQVTAIKLTYDQATPKTFQIAVGDDRESENPVAAATRSLASLWSAVGILFGSGDLF